MGEPNVYTRRWFSTFLGRIDLAIVAREVAFLQRQLPPRSRVLDLCCGPGRHLEPLDACGYRVVGLDRDAAALAVATASAPAALLVRGDMRALPLASSTLDGVICMWQSFGHFDTKTNRDVLAEVRRVIRAGGVLILDLYHRDFYSANVGQRTIDRDGARVHELRLMHGDRLHVRLHYDDADASEEFDWQLYTPASLEAVARSVGLRLELACSEFDEQQPASGERPRMQLLFRNS